MRLGEQPRVEPPNKLREASLAETHRMARQTEAELAYTNPEKKPYQPAAEDMIEFVTPAQEADKFVQAKRAAEENLEAERAKVSKMLAENAGNLTKVQRESALNHIELLEKEYREKYLQ